MHLLFSGKDFNWNSFFDRAKLLRMCAERAACLQLQAVDPLANVIC